MTRITTEADLCNELINISISRSRSTPNGPGPTTTIELETDEALQLLRSLKETLRPFDDSGDYNTGDYNTGSRNTGSHNSGNRNTGSHNSGDYNTGDYNTGFCNTGFFNTGSHNTGFFNTITPEDVVVFDGTMTNREAFLESIPEWLFQVSPIQWVKTEAMAETEKSANPDHSVTGRHPRRVSMHDAYQKAWDESDRDVDAVRAMPGFDYEVWLEITGVELSSVEDSIVVEGVTYYREGTQ